MGDTGQTSIETTRIYLRRSSSEQQQIVDEVITWEAEVGYTSTSFTSPRLLHMICIPEKNGW